jgi:hypothetical protein
MSKLLSLTWHKVLPVEFSLSGKLATQLGSSTGQSGLVASNSTKLTRSWMSSQSSLTSLSSLQNVAMKVVAIAEPSAKKSLLCWVLMLSPVLQTFKRLHCATVCGLWTWPFQPVCHQSSGIAQVLKRTKNDNSYSEGSMPAQNVGVLHGQTVLLSSCNVPAKRNFARNRGRKD